jgi:hypothetical protein
MSERDERKLGREKGDAQHGRLGRRGVLKAGLVAGAVVGTGASRTGNELNLNGGCGTR